MWGLMIYTVAQLTVALLSIFHTLVVWAATEDQGFVEGFITSYTEVLCLIRFVLQFLVLGV